MWPFKKKPAKSVLDLPRYKDKPINLLFEDFIMKVIDRMPPGREEVVQRMNLQKVFSTKASEWREVIRETLGLSTTIEIAILDLWIRNRSCYDDTPEGDRAFAQDFADKYVADESKVDVWPEGTFEAAKKRIELFRNEA
jgi:hypothetical protein